MELLMKVNKICAYKGNAITRQYKRNKSLTYLCSAGAGTCIGSTGLCASIGENAKSLCFGMLSLLFLKEGINAFHNLILLSKEYDVIYQRAKSMHRQKL